MSSKNYRPRDIRRACDLCGHIWFMSELRYVGQNRWFCKDDSPGMTAEMISRHNAQVRPLIIKQAKHPRPQYEVPTYRLSEAACFRTVMDFAGTAEYVDQGGGVLMTSQYISTIALAGLYLADLLDDNYRPQWNAAARVKMLALADQLVALQVKGATGVPLYGSIAASGYAYSLDVALAGKLFLRAYAATSSQTYLDAATRCAWFLRAMQCLDVTGTYSVVDSTGNPMRTGGFGYCIEVVTQIQSGLYIQADMGLSFLAQLRAVVGGSTRIGAPVFASFFNISETIDNCITQAAGFYVDGTFRGTPLLSLSPLAFFNALTYDGRGSDQFGNYPNTDGSQYIRAWEFAFGLRSLFDLEGWTARVQAMFSWLMSFTATSYDPTLAVSQYLVVKESTGAAATRAAGTIYDLMAPGIMAPLYQAAGNSQRPLRDTVDKAQRMRPATDAIGGQAGVSQYDSVYPGPTGQLSFDGTAPMVTRWVEAAAALGGIYRYGPRASSNTPDVTS